MKKNIYAKYSSFLLISILIVVLSTVSYAGTWYPGSMHVHTGFSTFGGYPSVGDSVCPLFVEDIIPKYGYTVEQLAQASVNQNVRWNSYTDHSYCMNTA